MRVLLVEDQHLLREGLKLIVEAEGCFQVVAQAATALEALACPVEHDLVLMDLSLPDRDGIECIRELRAQGRTLPVLVVSMHESPAVVAQALAAGATGYVLKNASPVELRQALVSVAGGTAYVQAGLRADAGPHPALTRMERQLLVAASAGTEQEQLLERLSLSEASLASLSRSICRKLEADSLPAAAARAARQGWILVEPHGRERGA